MTLLTNHALPVPSTLTPTAVFFWYEFLNVIASILNKVKSLHTWAKSLLMRLCMVTVQGICACIIFIIRLLIRRVFRVDERSWDHNKCNGIIVSRHLFKKASTETALFLLRGRLHRLREAGSLVVIGEASWCLCHNYLCFSACFSITYNAAPQLCCKRNRQHVRGRPNLAQVWQSKGPNAVLLGFCFKALVRARILCLEPNQSH